MTNGKDDEDFDFEPVDMSQVPMSGFKIRFKKVLHVLSHNDPSKSANGINPKFWKECASILAIAAPVTRLFQFIERKAVYPSRWKIGRVRHDQDPPA